jgi:hypothetical protein
MQSIEGILTNKINHDQTVERINNIQTIENEAINETRKKLETVLKEASAKSFKDLSTANNQDIAFQIKLKDKYQKPIACKSRIIPFHLKSKNGMQ